MNLSWPKILKRVVVLTTASADARSTPLFLPKPAKAPYVSMFTVPIGFVLPNINRFPRLFQVQPSQRRAWGEVHRLSTAIGAAF